MAAAGAAGGLALARADPASAADGSNVVAGQTTTAESATELHFDGGTNPSMFFLANDTNLDSGDSAQPAALGGWASGSTVTNGVYGFTEASGGTGVVGELSFVTSSGNGVQGIAFGAGAIGVLGTNGAGTGVAGSSGSTAASATAILGTIASTSPGAFATAVRGQNNRTGSTGIGVWGSHDGGGWGGYFTSVSGFGAKADGGSGRGVVASGDAAQIQLIPGSGATHPAAGATGDIYVDSSVRAWFCQGGTTWAQLSMAGSEGPTGPKGPTGPEGPIGPQGATGPQGPALTRVIPSSSHHPPRGGKVGELFVDSLHRLWFCNKGGSRAHWKHIA